MTFQCVPCHTLVERTWVSTEAEVSPVNIRLFSSSSSFFLVFFSLLFSQASKSVIEKSMILYTRALPRDPYNTLVERTWFSTEAEVSPVSLRLLFLFFVFLSRFFLLYCSRKPLDR